MRHDLLLSRAGSVVLALTCASSGAARAADDVCAQPAELRRELFERPFAEIEHSRIGENVHRVRPGKLCEVTEKELLEYFVAAPEEVPTVTSRVEFDTHQPFERTRLFRTWEFRGLVVRGEVTDEARICPDWIKLDSARVALLCGLRVGAKASELEARLGPPDSIDAVTGKRRWHVDPDLGMGYEISLASDAAGAVSSIEWRIPRGH